MTVYYQFKAELGEPFQWDYLEQGPEVWRVRIGGHRELEKRTEALEGFLRQG